jgi:hypothetical protein
MERCPNCRARVRDRAECRRCGMDLTLLVAAEQAADRLIGTALARLAGGDRAAAQEALRRARGLRGDPLVDELLAFLHLEEQPAVPVPVPEPEPEPFPRPREELFEIKELSYY